MVITDCCWATPLVTHNTGKHDKFSHDDDIVCYCSPQLLHSPTIKTFITTINNKINKTINIIIYVLFSPGYGGGRSSCSSGVGLISKYDGGASK